MSASLISRPRFIPSRELEPTPPRFGEKPLRQMVSEAFDGPVLRLSQRIRLLEEADNRRIRRGDAIDLIEAVQRDLEAKHAVRPPGKMKMFARHFAAFAAIYIAAAVAWCLLV